MAIDPSNGTQTSATPRSSQGRARRADESLRTHADARAAASAPMFSRGRSGNGPDAGHFVRWCPLARVHPRAPDRYRLDESFDLAPNPQDYNLKISVPRGADARPSCAVSREP